ncbi:hypothetical protein T11_13213 [Trichinella zimbabwensis]|uniref:Uncharacterized protein n=1 Tax=Trichinella zimbabwensis TaxID=268475 RepID=A0A0V1GS36_9BILA|nr:hypothetical protein T11_13213 [Trichinella zimbabwensis]
MRRLPHGSSSTISINTVKSTSPIPESCFCYLTDIHLIRSSQFFPDTAIMQLITRTRRILSKWEYRFWHIAIFISSCVCNVCSFLSSAVIVESSISSIWFSSLDGHLFDSTSYQRHSTIFHRSTNICKNILFSKHYSVQLTRYSDEEQYGTPSQMAHTRQNDTTISLSSIIAAINITTKTTVSRNFYQKSVMRSVVMHVTQSCRRQKKIGKAGNSAVTSA